MVDKTPSVDGQARPEAPIAAVEVLGPLQVIAEGAVVDIGGPRGRLILSLLITSVDQVVSTSRLIDDMWGDEPPPTARKALQTHVSNLRRALGDGFPLRTAPGGYVLQSSTITIDAVDFERLVQRSIAMMRTDPIAASRLLGEALAMWRGSAYADLADESAMLAETTRLAELRLQAHEFRLDADLRAGRHAEVLADLEVLTADHPYRERLRELQMLALYRCGRQTEALRAYDRTRKVLAESLGIEPSPPLRALHQQVLEQSTDLDLADADADAGERYAFLATDIQDSTAMWEAEPDLMPAAVARHDQLLEDAVRAHSGRVFKGTGDGVYAVFASIGDAASAAAEAQQSLHQEPWPTARGLQVRMGVDEGVASARNDDYFGPVMNRVSRVMSSGHGGQVLVPDELSAGLPIPTRSLGAADYKGVGRIEVAQLLIDGLPDEFADLHTDRSPKSPSRSGFGRSIRGYEIRELLGEGAHGLVYRSYQSSVGREVAVKVIRPELANQSGFVKRFEAEAQFVAQLEHPHIVSLYDYWRDPEGAYLAMQLLRGGSLAASLDRAPWHSPAALLLLDQVGDALEYAHRHGVIHRDLKPANVLLDDDGNAYLSDFGIASDHVEAIGVPVESSVAYVSPEEIAGETVTTAADVYGMSLLTYEILTGDRPELGGQPGSVQQFRQDLPASLDAVIARGAHPDPSERYARVSDYLRALRQVFGANVTAHRRRAEPDEVRNPYKGLRAFTETDASDFFGREELVGELIHHVASHRMTAVVGPSGSGKSSLVRAGLVPAARRGVLAGPDGGGDVVVTEMFPGSFPFEELEAALLRVAVERQEGLLADLTNDDRGLLRVTKQILPDDGTELLLVIDQFEELFSLTTDERARADFLANLVSVVADERSRVRVVITVRADYFDRPLAVAEFGSLLQSALITVAMPGDQELRQAVSEPAAVAGLEFEPGLINRIVGDVVDEPGALPLLQYALTELVNEREGVVLTTDGYERSGAVAGALARRAEEIYDGFAPSARAATRDVFLRLVSVDDERNDSRRRVRRSELATLGLPEGTLESVLSEFGAFRLLSFDHDPVTRGPTVEIAHEAMLRKWPRYQGWIDERREDLLLERRLEAATTEWEASDRDPSFLFSGGQLAQYSTWAADSDVRLTEAERELLDRSQTTENEQRATSQRRRRLVMATVSAFAMITSVLALVAWVQMRRADDSAVEAADERVAALEAADLERVQRERAEASRQEAETAQSDAEAAEAVAVAAGIAEGEARDAAVVRRLVADSAALSDRNPTVAMLLALEAYERQPAPSTLGALLTSLQRDDGYLGFMPSTTVSDGGHWIGSADDDTLVVRTRDSIDVYDLERRALAASTPSPSFQTGPFVWGASGGGRFGTINAAFELVLLDRGDTTPEVFEAAGVATAVGFSENDSMIVGSGPLVRLFSGPDLADVRTLGTHGNAVLFAALTPDGRFAATSDVAGTITLWDTEAEAAVWSWTKWAPERWVDEAGVVNLGGRANEAAPTTFGFIEGSAPEPDPEAPPEPLVGEIRFSRDGTSLYTTTAGLLAIDVPSGMVQWQLPVSQLQITELSDGRLLGGDRVIADASISDDLSGLPIGARTTATPDGSIVAALSTEGITLWSGDGDQLIAESVDRGDHNFATMGTDPNRVASYFVANGAPDEQLSARLSDVDGSVVSPDEGLSKLAYTKTGELVTTYGLADAGGESIVVRDPVTFDPLGPPLPVQRWGAIQVSADRRFVAVGYISGQFDGYVPVVNVYELATAELVVTLKDGFEPGGGWGVFNMEFSPDGSLLAASDIGDVVVWSTATWDVVHVFRPTADDSFLETAFMPDGSALAVASQRNGVQLFDLTTGEGRSLAAGTVAPIGYNNINGLAFDRDGRYAVVAGDGANLIDVESGLLIGEPFPSSSATQGASVASGAVSLVTSTEDHLLVWDLTSDDWPEIACTAAGRNLTLDEWEQFGWPDAPYNGTCSQWPDPS